MLFSTAIQCNVANHSGRRRKSKKYAVKSIKDKFQKQILAKEKAYYNQISRIRRKFTKQILKTRSLEAKLQTLENKYKELELKYNIITRRFAEKQRV